MQRRSTGSPSKDHVLPVSDNNNWVKRKKQIQQQCNLVRHLHDFLHARTGPKGCRLVGYIRVCYALLFLYSRILLAVELPFIFDPHSGVLPYRATMEQLEDTDWSIFEIAPDSRLLLYGMYFMGLLHGVLFLLGVASPRLQAFGIFFFLHNLHNHNKTLWDYQEIMLKMWAFMFLWLPLDHITIKDGFGTGKNLLDYNYFPSSHHDDGQQQQQRGDDDVINVAEIPTTPQEQHATLHQHTSKLSTSWPMWPFRLWQVYTCLVYMGAGLGKLTSDVWRNGTALYYCYYDVGFGRFFPSFFIELFFNRMWAIKLMTWASLMIECLCFVTIWFRATRKWTFVAIVLLHIGIELSLLMHIFEYIAVLGWVVFFVYPNDDDGSKTTAKDSIADANNTKSLSNDDDDDDKTADTKKNWTNSTPTKSRKLLETVVAVSLLYVLVMDAIPMRSIMYLVMPYTPPTAKPWLRRYFARPISVAKRDLLELDTVAGLHSGPWNLFGGVPHHSKQRLTAVVRFRNSTRQPLVWKTPEWSEQSLYERERYYWSDTYYDYLLEDSGSVEYVPLFALLSKYIAQKYSAGGISLEKDGRLVIEPDKNDIKSISFMGHWETGLAPPKKLGLFESIPRRYQRSSMCLYVLHLKKMIKHGEVLNMYEYDEDMGVETQSGCFRYDEADDEYHNSHGSYAN